MMIPYWGDGPPGVVMDWSMFRYFSVSIRPMSFGIAFPSCRPLFPGWGGYEPNPGMNGLGSWWDWVCCPRCASSVGVGVHST